MRKFICKTWFFVLLLLAFPAAAQDKKITPEEYIATYKDLAISEMKRTGIPASITLSQGLLESGIGNSELAKQSNNHFGIKCKKDWTGRTVNYDDDAPQECFRAYEKPEDSYIDHSDFLVNSPRYASLFELEPTDYKGWANGLKQAGYATNPKYPQLLISAIERHSLYQYDLGNKRVPKEESKPEVFVQNNQTKNTLREYNNIPAYVVKEGDTYDKISSEKKMMRWEITKYNDLSASDKIVPGTILYLKPKRRKAKLDYHIVQEGENMYYISQAHAIKLKQLYRKNRMTESQEPQAGERLYLRNRRPESPKIRNDKKYAGKKIGVMAGEKMASADDLKPEKTPEKQPEKKQENKVVTEKKQEKNNPYVEKKEEPKNQQASVKEEKTPYKDEPKNTFVIPAEVFNPAAEFHTVKDGETMDKIAIKYNVSTKEIQEWNEMTDQNLYAGQLLRVRALKTQTKTQQIQMPDGNVKAEVIVNDDAVENEVPVEEKASENYVINGYYTVKQGETVFSISRKLQVPVNKIHEWNNLEDNTVKPGQRLKIKTADEAENVAVNNDEPEADVSTNLHVVEAGETLYSISRKYGVSVDALKLINGLGGNAISPGQKLKVKQ
ncbi:MAG: LysM peptidoglycan-binding domain-containing protein [Bacteroidia bacterium]